MQDRIVTYMEDYPLTHSHADSVIQMFNEQAGGWNEGNATLYANAFSEHGWFR